MLRVLRWMLPAVAAMGLFVSIGARVAQAADEATLTGTVVDADGKAVADVKVNITKPRVQGQQGRPEALATATTDAEGKFSLALDKSKLPDGEYSVGAFVQAKGFARAKVTIKDGKSDPATLSLKLAPMQRRGGGAGGAAQ